jgi:hypothetical protein
LCAALPSALAALARRHKAVAPESRRALPENAVVICVDEKPSIQAPERAQGDLKLPDGRALSAAMTSANGTSTLLAAFEVATGKVVAQQEKAGDAARYLFRTPWPIAWGGTGSQPCRAVHERHRPPVPQGHYPHSA